MAKSKEERMLDRAADSVMRAGNKQNELMEYESTGENTEKTGPVLSKKKIVPEESEKSESNLDLAQEKTAQTKDEKIESPEKTEVDQEDFAVLVQKYDNFEPPKTGDIIPAKVVQITREGLLLDIGTKSEGFMPWEEHSSEKNPQLGEKMLIFVSKKDEAGRFILSKNEADLHLDWAKFSEAFEQGEPIILKVEKVVKGGLLAILGSLKAFIPASHVSLKKREDLMKYLGKNIRVRIIELDRNSKNIVASRKFLLLEEKEKRKELTLSGLKEGEIVTGRVNSITNFGVFVDLGGIDGLIHPENLSWGWVKDPQEIVSVGRKIRIKVLKLDRDKGKISLGLKQTKPDPWSLVKDKYQVNSLVKGKITHLTNFGAFVEIEEGLEGLIHVSDLSWDKRIEHPREIIKVGDEVEVKILGVDAEGKKMALGLKQTQPDPWEKLLQEYKIGDIISGKVEEITNFGVFVNLAPGIDGLIHVSELDNEYVTHPEKVTAMGEKIEAQIVEIDHRRRRIRLSVRQLKEKIKKVKKVKEQNVPLPTPGDEEISIGDFIGEKIREKLRKGFTNK